MSHGEHSDFFKSVRESGAPPEEMEAMARTWERMSEWRDEQPGPMVRARFYQMLEAYEEGRRAATAAPAKTPRFSWWPLAPAWQFAAAACLLVLGLYAGSMRPWERGSNSQELATLRSEVQNMRQLVALSLLQQQSASDRLRGVTYSYRVESSDTEVLSALLRTVNSDTNVNVRLAAVDALRPFLDSPVARRGIVQALPKQSSPLVQVGLLDLVREMRDSEAAVDVKSLIANENLDETVRQRAQMVAAELSRH
jgi:hypothetical protein